MEELLKYSICIQIYKKNDNNKFPHIKIKSIVRMNTQKAFYQTMMFKYNLYTQVIYIDHNQGLGLLALQNT